MDVIGWESGREFLDKSQNEVKQTQRNLGSLSTLNWKLLNLMKQNNLFNFTISWEQLLNNTICH